jgi:hypothetical protein
MKVKTSEEIVKYTVKIKGHSKRGCFVVIQGALRQPGDFERNIIFKENGISVGRDGFIEKIYKIEFLKQITKQQNK